MAMTILDQSTSSTRIKCYECRTLATSWLSQAFSPRLHLYLLFERRENLGAAKQWLPKDNETKPKLFHAALPSTSRHSCASHEPRFRGHHLQLSAAGADVNCEARSGLRCASYRLELSTPVSHLFSDRTVRPGRGGLHVLVSSLRFFVA